MADICSFGPQIDGEDSKLYKELLEFTGKNRPLTNYLYATAIQDWFKEDLASSDFNSQKEPNLSVVVDKLNVNEMLNVSDAIRNAEEILNVRDSNGVSIGYDTVSEIIDRVQNYNSNGDNRVVAVIKMLNGKYHIVVLPKDDTNFYLPENYNAGINGLNIVNSALQNAGFNTIGLSVVALQALNALNAGFFTNTINKFLEAKTQDRHAFFTSEIQLALELLKDTPEVKRIKQMFPDEDLTADVVKYLLSVHKIGRIPEIPDNILIYKDIIELRVSDIRNGNSNIIDGFRKALHREFSKVNLLLLKSDLEQNYKDTVSKETRTVRHELLDLYKKFDIDKDVIVKLTQDITSIEDLTNSIIVKLKNQIKVQEARGTAVDEDTLKQIAMLEEKIAKKEYLNSILDFLHLATEQLQLIQELQINPENYEKDSLTFFNETARQITMLKDQMAEYSPVITALLSLDILDQAEDLEDSDIKEIKKLASTLNDAYSVIKRDLAKKIFEVVREIIRPFWRDEKRVFKSEGTDREIVLTLTDALRCCSADLNFIDRFVLSGTEIHEPVLAALSAAIKSIHDERDDRLRDITFDIRRWSDPLYRSNSNSEFMFETLQDGTVKIASEIDWDKYYKARAEEEARLKANGLSGKLLNSKLTLWEAENLGDYTVTVKYQDRNEDGELVMVTDEVVVLNVPNENYRKELPKMTAALRTYYDQMLGFKAKLEFMLNEHGVKTDLFTPVLITNEISDAIMEAKSPSEAWKLVKDNFVDNFVSREDDTQFGEIIVGAGGREIRKLPVFYTQTLKDQRRVSKDFSRAMTAFAAMTMNYVTMAERVDSLELVRDFLEDRPVLQTRGDKKLATTQEILGKKEVTPATKPSRETNIKGWLDDTFESLVYSARQKKERSIKPLSKLDTAKTANAITAYTSLTGLTLNVPGAIANLLVGKLQMLIEAGAKEFFSTKDMVKASAQYDKMVFGVIQDLANNNKNSKLALLMEYFDVTDDFYASLKETGFHKSALGKILLHSSLMFLYGMGEHLLHAQGMLACLNHEKVRNVNTGKEVPLFEVFDLEKMDNNSRLIIKEGYVTLKEGRPIDKAYIDRLKKRISYVNRSMHGAFGADEKGYIHRMAIGRLIMNFRQWMPAHFARRFNTLHYDYTLDDWREGYYVTTFKFIKRIAKDMKDAQFDVVTRWKQLTEMERANMLRTFREGFLLILLLAIGGMGFGDDPKHRSWLQAMLKYQIRRMYMETAASSPFSIVMGNKGFFGNMWTLLNSPMAAISSAQKLTNCFGIWDLITMERIQSGPNKGKLKYLRNWERAIPYYDQVNKWWNMDTDDSMFTIFN